MDYSLLGMTNLYSSHIQSGGTKINSVIKRSDVTQINISGARSSFSSTLMSEINKTESSAKNSAVDAENNFEKMWMSKYPGAKYHVMDAAKISQGVWERNDFPFEKFFEDTVDESVLKWQPSGKEPDMADGSVQMRLNSTLGQKSIIVPPELEEKMKNNPALAQKVMDKVDEVIANNPGRPGRVCSYLISLDENGNVAHYRATSGGGNISGPSKEEQRKFEEEQEEKRKRLLEKRALEKKWQQEAIDARCAYNNFLNEQAALKTSSATELIYMPQTVLGVQISSVLSAYKASPF